METRNIREDIAFAESRMRAETVAAEDILHDLGAISLFTSDSQAMGRIGETVCRTWQTAHKMKEQFGALPEDVETHNDNFRVKRYIAKYTINPALAHGIADYVGSIEAGKYADLVLWHPAFFGIKPELVIKGGQIVTANMGPANASIPTAQPLNLRSMFGAYGSAVARNSLYFVSAVSLNAPADIRTLYRVRREMRPVNGTRAVRKQDMLYNDYLPCITVDPETYEVTVQGNDGEERKLCCQPAKCVPLARRYLLF
ncbi:urease-like [Tropilaelaps mercedesae]|uniref:urease n=1 Tax=Tropilaelaps mercedesae TaxID=418985 RepID=A0A1V9XAH0_9ACAR|nr:urease-like [Tropilaelaps mercedesae]